MTFNDAAIDRQVRFQYDGQGRETEAQRWSSGAMLHKRTTIYEHRAVVTVPPPGGTVTRQLLDGWEQVIAERRYHGASPTGSYDESTYSYDQLDRLTTVVGPGGATWSYQYDLAGRQVSATDPDTGTTTAVFNDAGQPVEVTDARGVTLVSTYDQLGRRIALREDSPTGPARAEWLYDTLELGQLTSTTRYDDGLAYTAAVTSYDDDYRPLGSQVSIPASTANGQLAGVYAEQMTYYPDGSVATHELPALGGQPAEVVSYTYTDTGLTDTVIGLDDYVTTTTYRWDGAVAETRHGEAGKQTRQSWSYEEATGRLLTTQVDTEDPANPGAFLERFATNYSYDDAGNVSSAAGHTNGVLDQVECFEYDGLRRLTRAWTQNVDGCGTPQATGADAYHRSWTFDASGNRLSQIDHDPVAGDTTWSYLVGPANGVTTHQLAEVTASGPKAATQQRTFAYDLAGYMTSRTTDTGAVQTLDWDAEGRLASVTEASDVTSYVYDADGNRLLAREPGKTTLYLGSAEVEEQAGGALVGTRYYGDTAVRTFTGLSWVVNDRNSTATIQIHADTLDPNRRRMLPYGEPRGVQPNWVGSKGYVGGTTDGTGLTQLGARAYDPTLGRFVSVDPVMDLDDMAQWHGYSYANNNPLTWADPDGLMPACIDWCGSPADKSVRAAQQKKSTSSGGPQSRAVPPQKKPASSSSSSKGNGSSVGSSTKDHSPKPTSKKKPKPNANPAPMCSQGLADICIDDSKVSTGGGGSSESDLRRLAGQVGDTLAAVSFVLGFVPSLVCGPFAAICTGIKIALSAIAGVLQIVAGKVAEGVATILGAAISEVLGPAGRVLARQISTRVTPSLLFDLGVSVWNYIPNATGKLLRSGPWVAKPVLQRLHNATLAADNAVRHFFGTLVGGRVAG